MSYCRNGRLLRNISCNQGWAREVKARDRDETETLTSRDRDVGFTSRDETETRRDRDVKIQVLLIAITGLDVIFHVHCF